MIVTILLAFYENPSRKKNIKHSCPEQYLISKVKNNILLRYYFFDYKHLFFLNTPHESEMNFIENNYLPGLLMSYPTLLHATA